MDDGAEIAESIHITQCRHPVYNPTGDPFTENCGPTSLAMACRRKGLPLPPIPGRSAPSHPQEMVDSARFWMFANSEGVSLNEAKDGVQLTEGGLVRAPEEHLTLINLPDLQRGCENLGLHHNPLKTFDQLDLALKDGSFIILAGDPSAPGSYGERLSLTYQGGHILLITSPSTVFDGSDRYLANDPLLDGPAWLSRSELLHFAETRPFDEVIGLALS